MTLPNLTRQQRVLLLTLKVQGVIKIKEAHLTKSMRSLKLLHSYGLVTNTADHFCLSPKGLTAVKEWE